MRQSILFLMIFVPALTLSARPAECPVTERPGGSYPFSLATDVGFSGDEESTGDGAHSPDAKNIAVGSLRLRAERQGNSDGRVYLIIAEATDSSGNRGFSCCTVAVPHANSRAAQTSAAQQAAAARDFCSANGGTAPADYFVVGDGPEIGPKQ